MSDKSNSSLVNKENVCRALVVLFSIVVGVSAVYAAYAYKDFLPEFPFLSKTPKVVLPEIPKNCRKGVGDSYMCTVKVDKTSADCVSEIPKNCMKGVGDSYMCTVKVDKTSADCVSELPKNCIKESDDSYMCTVKVDKASADYVSEIPKNCIKESDDSYMCTAKVDKTSADCVLEIPKNCIKESNDSYMCTVKVDKTSADCVSNCQDEVCRIEDEFFEKHYPTMILEYLEEYFNVTSKLSFEMDNDSGVNTVCSNTCDGSASNILNGNVVVVAEVIEVVNSQGVTGEIVFSPYLNIRLEY